MRMPKKPFVRAVMEMNTDSKETTKPNEHIHYEYESQAIRDAVPVFHARARSHECLPIARSGARWPFAYIVTEAGRNAQGRRRSSRPCQDCPGLDRALQECPRS